MKIIATILILCILVTSCAKDKWYIEHPTCRRFQVFIDQADKDGTYTGTIEWHPEDSLSQIACNQMLIDMENLQPCWEGCPSGGYVRYRYVFK